MSARSGTLRNHRAAVSLYLNHYNLCRVHEAIRCTPAMALGLTDHIWSIGELLGDALEGALPNMIGELRGKFRVIEGGKA